MDALNLRANRAKSANRALRVVVALSACFSLGAGYRTENFVVTAPTASLARDIGDAAERYREELAVEWLGQALPRWAQPCPITAAIKSGAGGKTSFMFERGVPFNWIMEIQGSPERILDSVLPHEITHTIFATHFGRPLPRWADEGACTTVEHPSERARQDEMLLQYMKTDPPRSIPFNQMYRMTEYPHDIMPLYAQGHSVARFLLYQGGKRKFVDYVGRGMQTEDWDNATREFYGYRDLSELQLSWVKWVGSGSPRLGDDSTTALVSRIATPNPSSLTIRTPLPPLLRPMNKEMDSVKSMDHASTTKATFVTSTASAPSWYAGRQGSKPQELVHDRNLKAASAQQPMPSTDRDNSLTPRSLLPPPTYDPMATRNDTSPNELQWRNVPAAAAERRAPLYFDAPVSNQLLR